MIQTSIARGWLEGPEHADRRARLVNALASLALDPASPSRDSLQAYRLLAVSMTAANLRMLDPSLPRRRKHRHRMRKTLQGEGDLRAGRAAAGPQNQAGRGQHPVQLRSTEGIGPLLPH